MIELTPGIFLLPCESQSVVNSLLTEEKMEELNILFRGDLSVLMELSSKYVLEIEKDRYKDYYYNSVGFSAPTMSIQSAIWASEEIYSKEKAFNYFIILKVNS